MDEYLKCLKSCKGNDINKKLQAFLNSIKKIRILENESSYKKMMEKVSITAERLISSIEVKHSLNEETWEEYINLYANLIKEFSKYQIIFIGNSGKAMILSQFINCQKAHILRDFNGNIPDYCDFVIVLDPNCSLENIPEHSKIIRLDRILMKFDISPETAYYNKKLNSTLGLKKGYVTGLSYEQRGISWEELEFDLGCLAAPSQDLFTNTLSYMELYNKIKEKYGLKLQYCVLGMNFYALWYDLSLSKAAARMLCFYDRIGTLHHFAITPPP